MYVRVESWLCFNPMNTHAQLLCDTICTENRTKKILEVVVNHKCLINRILLVLVPSRISAEMMCSVVDVVEWTIYSLTH